MLNVQRKIKKYAVLSVLASALCTMPSAFSSPAPYVDTRSGSEWGSSVIFPYDETTIFQVFTMKNQVTDIMLKKGETLTGIVAGDTVQWRVENATVGNRPHVYIKPIVDNIQTNFILNTDKRSYHLDVSSMDIYTPIVSWTYPEETGSKGDSSGKKGKSKEEDSIEKENEKFMEIFTETRSDGKQYLKNLNNKYKTKGSRKASTEIFPTEIFDDGTRTYIKVPLNNKYDLPVLYRVDDKNKKKLTLVNYRVRYGYFIADRVFDHARLKFSESEWVDILPKTEKDLENEMEN